MIAVPEPDGTQESKDVYIAIGVQLTVNGNIQGDTEVLIGKTATKIPVISANELHTWNRSSNYDPYYDHYYRSPFYRHRFHYRHHYYWPHYYHYPRYRYRRCY